jgi:hypothetical protein
LRNDEDIKIFHPKKTGVAASDLMLEAELTDKYRRNGNMDKATLLGEKLAMLKPEDFYPEDCAKLKTNEVRQLRSLMVFVFQISIQKYLPHAMLASQAVNAMYEKISKMHPGLFENISDGSSYTFYYLSVRKNKNVEENIGKNYAMLCDRDNNEFYEALGTKVFTQTDILVCDLIEEFEFKA